MYSVAWNKERCFPGDGKPEYNYRTNYIELLIFINYQRLWTGKSCTRKVLDEEREWRYLYFWRRFENVIRTQFIIPKGFDEIYVKSAFIGAGINILINIILIPKFAAIGAAIGTLFAEIGVCVYQVGRVRKYLPIKKYIILGIPFLTSGIFMFLIIYFLELIVLSREVLILIKILVGAIIYFIFLGTQLYLIKLLRRV